MYVKQNKPLGYGCGAHPFQVCAPERAEAQAALPDATGRPVIALHAIWPPALLPAPPASASPGVPDSSTVTLTFAIQRIPVSPPTRSFRSGRLVVDVSSVCPVGRPSWQVHRVHSAACGRQNDGLQSNQRRDSGVRKRTCLASGSALERLTNFCNRPFRGLVSDSCFVF